MPRRPALSQQAIDALPYWPAIRSAAVNHLTTAALWEAIREVQAEYGAIGKGPSLQGINQLRAVASGIGRTTDELQRRDPSRSLRGVDIQRAPWARSYTAQRAQPRYQVQFQHTYREGGQLTTQWRSLTIDGRLPATVGDLFGQFESGAEDLADDYDVEHIGADNFQIMSI